jgi:hypothetical protein
VALVEIRLIVVYVFVCGTGGNQTDRSVCVALVGISLIVVYVCGTGRNQSDGSVCGWRWWEAV